MTANPWDRWRGIHVTLAPDEELWHCAHCDRYADDDPMGHPSCLIVKKAPAEDDDHE